MEAKTPEDENSMEIEESKNDNIIRNEELKDDIITEKKEQNDDIVTGNKELKEIIIKIKNEAKDKNVMGNKESEDEFSPNKLENEDKIKYQTFTGIKRKLNDEELEKQDFIFEEGKVKMANKNFIYQSDKGKTYFNYNSKIIKFSNKKEKKENYYFIHDKISLKNALTKTNITHGILSIGDKSSKKNENYNTNNSNGSQSSNSSIEGMNVSDILKSSYKIIEEPSEIKIKKIFSQDNCLRRFNYETISDLDFNFRHLDKEIINNKLCFNKTQNNWYGELSDLYSSNTIPYSFIFGPMGIGKTTTVLNYLNTEGIPRLYFSLKILSNPKFFYKQWKKYAMYETIYTFVNKEQMSKFSAKAKDIPNSSNLMTFITSYIKLILKFYTKREYKQEQKICIVIDDYNQDLYDKNYEIEEIINYVKSHNKELHLLIIGEGQYINERLYRFYANKTNDFSGVYWNLSIDDPITKTYKILKIPKYYYKYKNLENKNGIENIIKNDLTNKFTKINLASFFILSKYLNCEINIRELKDEFKNISFQYITLNKRYDINGNTLVKLSFNHEIYEAIFENSIKGLMKIDNLKTKINLFNGGDFGKGGIDFEDIIIEQLWNNTVDFLIFPESNKLKVNAIYELKDNIKDKRMNVNNSFPIIIRQTLCKAKYYDLLLILNQNNKKYAIFIQIGLSKTGFEINPYFANLTHYYNDYKKGIENLIDHQIDSIGFMLIFDYTHQKKLQENNNKSDGFIYCMINNIDFLILKNYKFYKNLEDDTQINSFKIENRTLLFPEEEKNINSDLDLIKKKFSDICLDMFLFRDKKPIIPISTHIKSKILNYINQQFGVDYNGLNFAFNVSMAHEGFGDFGIIDSDNFDQINIFMCKIKEKNEIYFGYNNRIFKISSSKILEVDNKPNENKYNWDRYFLKKKRKND